MATKATGGGRPAAKDRALDYVKSQVLTGAFPGGELISEGEVANALGMSRTPVREAFLQLESQGLLKLYPKRGALVVPEERDAFAAAVVRVLTDTGLREGMAARGRAYACSWSSAAMAQRLADIYRELRVPPPAVRVAA